MNYKNEEEREEYKERLSKQKNAIENLLKIAELHNRLFHRDMLQELHKRYEECQRLYKKLDKNEFEIAVVGLEKAGKSTFANALIKNKILPDADERCTYTSTCIYYGADKARVKFFSYEEFDRNFRQKLQSMGIEKTENYSVSTMSVGEYRKLFSQLSEVVRNAHEQKTNKDILNILENKSSLLENYLGKPDINFQGEQLKSADFRNYIVKKEVAIAVKEVAIESSKLEKMQNAIIYDVPGFDSPTQMHEDQTLDKMKKADAIILIASAKSPSFTGPALQVFHKADEDSVELSDKLFVFGNRADEANTLEKNMQTLKNEVAEAKLLKGKYMEERLFFGSAKAHLQLCGQEEGDDCINKIRSPKYREVLKNGDGIEEIYQKLVEYNQTERFAVLKRKVNENDKEVKRIFDKLLEEYKSDNNLADIQEVLKAGRELRTSSRKILKKNLEELRNEIRNKYNEDAPLSEKMKEQIQELFENKDFIVSNDEIEASKIRLEGTSPIINVEEVEKNIRSEKFEIIYDKFSQTVLKIAVEDHNTYFEKVLHIFCDAIEIDETSDYYEEIQNKIKDFLNNYKRNIENSDCYQSLIERFVRDLVEILIAYPYGEEARLNKFFYEINNFIGLVMFYDTFEGGSDYKKTFLSMAPREQPLLYALIFHEFKNSVSESRNIINYIKDLCKDTLNVTELLNSTEMITLITKFIQKKPIGAFDVIRKELTKERIKGQNFSDIIRSLRGIVNKTPAENQKEEKIFDFTDRESFVKQYKEHFIKNTVRTYEEFKNDYQTDLEILQDFLVFASIPAIAIEKPFISREVKALTDILTLIESEQYEVFIDDNLNLLRKEKYEEIKLRQKDYIVNQKVVMEIESVLQSMSF